MGMEVKVVDKNIESNKAKKINFDLYSKQCYKPILFSGSDNIDKMPKINDLSGPMNIFIFIKNHKAIKVHCYENIKFKELFNGDVFFLITFGGHVFKYEKIKEKTLKDLELDDGIIFLCQVIIMEEEMNFI